MATSDDLRQIRIDKLEDLKKNGFVAYPIDCKRTHQIGGALSDFEKLANDLTEITLVGRIRSVRGHGGATFVDIEDGSGKIQVFLKKDGLGEKSYQNFIDHFDIGDFIEAKGTLFTTNRGEKSVEVRDYKMLAKSLLPLPEKWHGLQDVEERFRKRYLDLLFNDDIKKKFVVRSKIIKTLRDFMNANGFMEVTTPTLQPLYGGASARPFKTHMHDLDIDLYLRIAPELYLKRLLVGGFERVFEFTTNFRNEGMDREHNPEFMVLEGYAAYKDIKWLMGFTEEIFNDLLTKVIGKNEIERKGAAIKFEKPFMRARFNDLLKKYADLDYADDNKDHFLKRAKELGVKVDSGIEKPGIADEIFKRVIKPELIQPTFVIEWPADILPLAKKIPGHDDFVSAFQFFVGGLEMDKAFSELNDPIDQCQRFKAQENRRAKGDEEAQRMDEDFIEALEYGMPPAAGFGIGLDRLIMFLTDSNTLREVILFPTMKPRSKEGEKDARTVKDGSAPAEIK
jgi:lysyl-tRNA synthetase class 2